jgi:hypothetical protein
MAYHKDDGSFWGGLGTAFLLVLAFLCGYTLRDSGYTFKFNQPPVGQEQQHDGKH